MKKRGGGGGFGSKQPALTMVENIPLVSFAASSSSSNEDDETEVEEKRLADGPSSMMNPTTRTTVTRRLQQIIRLHVRGMTCSACSGTVEGVLSSIHGVEKAAVSLTTGRAVVEFASSLKQNISDFEALLVSSLEDVGFEAEVEKETSIANIFLSVEGMTCSACTSAVEHALNDTPGVLSASVALLPRGSA